LQKHHSFSMLPKIVIIDSFAKAKYSINKCYKSLLDVSVVHSRVTRLHNNDGSKAITSSCFAW